MKKLILIGLALHVFHSGAAHAYNPCDLTQNGKCDVADVQCSIDTVTGGLIGYSINPDCTPYPELVDVNCDGKANVADVQLTISMALGFLLNPNFDPNNDAMIDACIGKIIPPFCGNKEVQEGEACDDGNHDADDGCDAFCQVEAVTPPDPVDPDPIDPPPPPLDTDQDGDPNSTDCAPLDPEASTLAAEICDGKDNDCDGWINEDVHNGCGGCEELAALPGEACSVGTGACSATGVYQCADLNEVACNAVPDPDCDVDEKDPAPVDKKEEDVQVAEMHDETKPEEQDPPPTLELNTPSPPPVAPRSGGCTLILVR